jgi:hypothetical protein
VPPATSACGNLTAQEQAAITPRASSLMARLGAGTAEVRGSRP